MITSKVALEIKAYSDASEAIVLEIIHEELSRGWGVGKVRPGGTPFKVWITVEEQRE